MSGKLQRLEYLDFLRGFAVLGLLLMNATAMGALDASYIRFENDLLSDKVLSAIQAMFFDGRFRSLFCLLFGIGLYIQMQNYHAKELPAQSILKNRLLWLLCFGVIHCTFIWAGDILILYALCGLFLLNKLDWEAPKLLKRGIVFVGIGFVLTSLFLFISEPIQGRTGEDFLLAMSIVEAGYGDFVVGNFMYTIAYILTFPLLSLFSLGGVMMIGISLFKTGELRDGFNKSQLIILSVITVVISAIDAVIAYHYPDLRAIAVGLLGSLSGLTMALLIWHLVVTFEVAKAKSIFVKAISNAGRMAFTLYILQSLIMTGILAHSFPQWNYHFSLADYMLLASYVIVFELIVAYFYFDFFKQGPLEFMWRRLVQRKIVQVTALKSDAVEPVT